MATRELKDEARRIHQNAMHYRRGIHLSAIFKFGSITKEVFYISPADIPLYIPHLTDKWDFNSRIWLWLYSVIPAAKRTYPKPRKKATPQAHLTYPGQKKKN